MARRVRRLVGSLERLRGSLGGPPVGAHVRSRDHARRADSRLVEGALARHHTIAFTHAANVGRRARGAWTSIDKPGGQD